MLRRITWGAILCGAASGCVFDKTIEGTVTAHVIDGDRAPVAGIPVFFNDPDGSVVAETVTGADGTAAEHVAPGGSVSVAFDYGGFTDLETWFGAVDGDHVWFLHDFGPVTVDVEVTLPGAFAGADAYYVSSGCNEAFVETAGDPGVIVLAMNGECVTDPLTITAIAVGPAGVEQPLAFGIIGDAGNPADTPLAVSVDTWRTDFEAVALSLSSIPAGAAFAGGRTAPIRDGWRVLPSWRDVVADPVDSATIPLARAPGFGDSQAVTAWAYFADESEQVIVRNDPGASTTPAIDFAEALPRITGVSADRTEPERPVISWTTGDVSGADEIYVVIGWADGFWWLRGPPDTAAPFRPPMVPLSLAGYQPPSDWDSLFLRFDDLSYVGDADARRNHDWIPGTDPSGAWTVRASFAWGN